MNNQKSRFWTFWFSLVPGAGQMYFGMYRCGVSLMLAFLLLLIVPFALNLGALAMLAIVLWFYGFTLTHNMRAMAPEQFRAMEDRYFWYRLAPWGFTAKPVSGTARVVISLALILLGVYIIFQNFFHVLGWYLPSPIADILCYLPQIGVGVLIIILGVYLIRGKKVSYAEEEIPAYEPEMPIFTAAPSEFTVPAADEAEKIVEEPAEPTAEEEEPAVEEGDGDENA